jgi:hypothetical protein
MLGVVFRVLGGTLGHPKELIYSGQDLAPARSTLLASLIISPTGQHELSWKLRKQALCGKLCDWISISYLTSVDNVMLALSIWLSANKRDLKRFSQLLGG